MLRLIVFTVLAAVMLAATTSAQPTAPISVPKPHGRVFDKLSPGDQKIARALYDAQPAGATSAKAKSLDEIAAMKRSGKGWGGIFKEMKGSGLLQDSKNLGEVVSRAPHGRGRGK